MLHSSFCADPTACRHRSTRACTTLRPATTVRSTVARRRASFLYRSARTPSFRSRQSGTKSAQNAVKKKPSHVLSLVRPVRRGSCRVPIAAADQRETVGSAVRPLSIARHNVRMSVPSSETHAVDRTPPARQAQEGRLQERCALVQHAHVACRADILRATYAATQIVSTVTQAAPLAHATSVGRRLRRLPAGALSRCALASSGRANNSAMNVLQ